MTRKKVIEQLKSLIADAETHREPDGTINMIFSDDIEALNIAIYETEYRVPKKPKEIVREFGDRTLGCPACAHPIGSVVSSRRYQPRYCHFCGQALDWRENNDN